MPDAVSSRPWSPEDGPPPEVTIWPYGAHPAMYVRIEGCWSLGTVLARQDWPGGRIVYQIAAEHGVGLVRIFTYAWPQPGLRPARQRPASRSAA